MTEECLLDPSRNPHLNKEQIEAMVKEYLGVEKVIWLWAGMAGDDEVVNGHVDNMACFSKPGTVCISWTEDKTDPQVGGCWRGLWPSACLAAGAAATAMLRPGMLIHAIQSRPLHPAPSPAPSLCSQYERSARNVEILESTTDARGRKIEVIKVPCPPPMFRLHAEADGVDVGSGLTGCRPAAAAAGVVLLLPGSCTTTVLHATRWDRIHLPPALPPAAADPSPDPPPSPPLQPSHIEKGYVPRKPCARLPGSYINHYVANGGVVIPSFGYPTDQLALEALQRAYPDRKVVQVPGGTREPVLNAGNVHCITQQHVAA